MQHKHHVHHEEHLFPMIKGSRRQRMTLKVFFSCKGHTEISSKAKYVEVLSDPGVVQLNLLLFVVSDHSQVL